MGFSSIDDLINEITANGKYDQAYFQKTIANGATSAAGRWHETFSGSGVPAAGTFSGTAGVATAMDNTTTGALYNLANVSTDTRHLLTIAAWTSVATMVPATAILCDFLLYYPSCVVTGTPTTLNNTVTLPRYTTGDGVMAFVATQSALSAASPALTLTYDSPANTGQTAVMTAPANSLPISSCFLNNGQVFVPLGTGDTGVKKITSYTLASGATGTVAFVLCKPLAMIPLLTANVASERDLVMQLPSMPRVYDGACLGWLIQVGGALVATTSTVSGMIGMGYG